MGKVISHDDYNMQLEIMLPFFQSNGHFHSYQRKFGYDIGGTLLHCYKKPRQFHDFFFNLKIFNDVFM